MEKTDQFFMQAALLQARLAGALYSEVPVGAVLVKNNQIIAQGSNYVISGLDPTAHAEIVTIKQAAKLINNYRLIDTVLYVTLEPCAMCLGAIIQARINRVVFGAYDPKFGALGSIVNLHNYSWNHKFQYTGGILAEECANLLKEFFKNKRN